MTTGTIFDVSLEQLRERHSLKWFTHPTDVIPAWVAEMDAAMCPASQDALIHAIERGDMGYPNRPAYLTTLSQWFQRQLDWDVPVERMRSVGDVMTGVAALIQLLSHRGDTVVINPPVYAPFYEAVRDTQRRLAYAPLAEDGRLDLEALEKAFAGDAVIYLLSNPHNPTGVVHTPEELSRVAELAERYSVWVISDEIHAPLVHPGSRFTPYLSIPGARRAMAVHSPSKAYNLAAVKAAVIVGSEHSAAGFARWAGTISGGVSHLGVVAQMAAMESGDEWLAQLRTELDQNRNLLKDLLQQHLPQVRYSPPEATYLAWLDCRGLYLGENPAEAFLAKGRVALSPGPSFGPGGGGHVRLNFATSPQILTEIVARMASAVA